MTLTSLIPALFFCLLAGTALAAGGGDHGDGGSKMADLLYRFINFALLVIILFVVLRKAAIKDFFANRRAEIAQRLESLKNEKAETEKKYLALEKKLKDFEEQRKQIIAQYRAEGEAEKERILAEARVRAGQIVAQAELTIQREIQAARERLKAEVLVAAASRAEEIISREIKDNDQDRLVSEFIERVEKLH
jgi:F-type H+-transporting ATPase subunit b